MTLQLKVEGVSDSDTGDGGFNLFNWLFSEEKSVKDQPEKMSLELCTKLTSSEEGDL